MYTNAITFTFLCTSTLLGAGVLVVFLELTEKVKSVYQIMQLSWFIKTTPYEHGLTIVFLVYCGPTGNWICSNTN